MDYRKRLRIFANGRKRRYRECALNNVNNISNTSKPHTNPFNLTKRKFLKKFRDRENDDWEEEFQNRRCERNTENPIFLEL